MTFKKQWIAITLGLLSGCTSVTETQSVETPVCTPKTLAWIESQVGSGDGQGHGPDIGTREWRGTILHRLGVENAHAKAADENQWCATVLNRLKSREK